MVIDIIENTELSSKKQGFLKGLEVNDNGTINLDFEKLKISFRNSFDDFIEENETSEEEPDYSITDWHYGFMCIHVNLFNMNLFKDNFLEKINSIIDENGECAFQFECYENDDVFRGDCGIKKDCLYATKKFHDSNLLSFIMKK